VTVQKEALPTDWYRGRASALQGGDALESNSGRFFGVVNSLCGFVILPLQGCQGKRVVLENKKRDSGSAIPEMGTKKGKGIPNQQDTLARNCVKQLS